MEETALKHLESMSEEIEELKRTRVYTLQEANILIKERKALEDKINSNTKELQYIKDYIQYEKSYIQEIKERKRKFQIAINNQRIEINAIKRVKALYQLAMDRYPIDYAISLSFYKFCKQFNLNEIAADIIKHMIKLFPNKPEVFQVAVSWYTYRKQPCDAFEVVRKGITIHPQDKFLHRESIRMQLLYSNDSKLLQTPGYNTTIELLTDQVKSIFVNIDDCNYLIDILGLLEPHHFTENVQVMIIDELMRRYPDEEITWHVIAQRERRGIHYNLHEIVPIKSTKFRIQRCIKTYRDGLEKIPDGKKNVLWCQYLDTMVEIQDENPNVAKMFKTNALKAAIEDAIGSGVILEERHYIAWIDLFPDDIEAVLDILEKGNKELPQSCNLWQLHIKVYMANDNLKELNKVFKRAVIALKEKAEPMWSLFVTYHSLMSSNEIMEAIYLDAIKEPEAISNIYKPQYITWVLNMKGIKEAREVYKAVSAVNPYCKELHITMAKAEMLEIPGVGQDFDEWEKCLNLACEQFGQTDVDVWLRYVEFYSVYNKTTDAKEKIQQICSEAKKNLPDLRFSMFTRQLQDLLDETPIPESF